uniref:Uncharacterized protein n=1 Tax=Anguilla anguilla TaxID=7936 RepID=A0A0E9Y177_ANGAN
MCSYAAIMTAVAYVNHQGGMRSLQLHGLAHRLLVWSSRHFLWLRVTHVALGLLLWGSRPGLSVKRIVTIAVKYAI